MRFHIPVIDLSRSYEEIQNKVLYACQHVGFFSILNHGIDYENLLQISKDFFNLPNEEKMLLSNKNNSDNRGYFPSSINGKEGLDLNNPNEVNCWDDNTINEVDKYINTLHNIGCFLFNLVNSNNIEFTKS